MSKFDGQKVVVTGAAGTLGQAVADAFHQNGADVVGLDIVAMEAVYASVVVDLIDPNETQKVLEQLSRIDVLANIAGGFVMGDSVSNTSDETWDFMMNLNARTVLNTVRATVPRMQARGDGKIINVGARNGVRGVGSMAAYSASKSVVIRLTESLSEELKSDGINVNCILPGIIDTKRNRADMPQADFSKWVKPVDMAKIVLFLASSAADPIHGAAIPAEGLS